MGLFSNLFPRHTLKPASGRASIPEVELGRSRVAAADPEAARKTDPEAYERWRNGELRPWALTNAFNARGFYGSWVDEALDVEDPMIDIMEAGKLYPGWTMLVKIAALVDTTPGLLISDPGAEPRLHTHHGSLVAAALRRQYAQPIVEFTTSFATHDPEQDPNIAYREAFTAAIEEVTQSIASALRNTNPEWVDLSDDEVLSMVQPPRPIRPRQ